MERFSLKWNDYQNNVAASLIKFKDIYCDTSLLSEDGEVFEAHRILLSASSKFFEQVFAKADHVKPLIFMKGIKNIELKLVLHFIYNGEVEIVQDKLDAFLNVANELKWN